MNLLEILTIFLYYFYRKCVGSENLSFDLYTWIQSMSISTVMHIAACLVGVDKTHGQVKAEKCFVQHLAAAMLVYTTPNRVVILPNDRDLRRAWFGEYDVRKCQVHETVLVVFRRTFHYYFDELNRDLGQKKMKLVIDTCSRRGKASSFKLQP